jgi:hypothetical protein
VREQMRRLSDEAVAEAIETLRLRAQREALMVDVDRHPPADPVRMPLIWKVWHSSSSEDIDSATLARALMTGKQRCTGVTVEPRDWRLIEAARWWTEMKATIRSTCELHLNLVRANLRFASYDSHATARVVAYRLAEELKVTRPKVLDSQQPEYTDIEHAKARFGDYQNARELALGLIESLVYVQGLRSKTPVSRTDRAPGPRPPPDIPKHVYIARLAKLGMCSERRLKAFMAEEFLRLPYRKQAEFLEAYHLPLKGRSRYGTLPVWLSDNTPVFIEFNWRWRDVFDAICNQLPKHPADSEALRKYASKHNIAPRFEPTSDALAQVSKSSPLLSPAPIPDL